MDLTPATAGNQTAQATAHSQFSSFIVSAGGTARATSTTTVLRAPTSIATAASPAVVLGGGTLSDRATVSDRVAPAAGATIDFRLYGPGDTTCSASPVFTSPGVPYPQSGGEVLSGAFTPAAAGTYRWIATYSGDVNNAPSSGTCGAAGETTTVARATPTITTTASADVVLGAGTVSDSATVGDRIEPQAGATIDFRLYGPDDGTCSGAPVFESLGVPSPRTRATGARAPAARRRCGARGRRVYRAGEAELQHGLRGGRRRRPRQGLDADAPAITRLPGTAAVDGLAIYLGTRLAPKSPLIARLVADGTAMRSIFGSSSQLIPFVGLVLGILAVRSSSGEPVPPSAFLTIAIAMASVLDAGAGMVAVLTFFIGVIAGGGFQTSDDVRLLLGLAALWCVVPVLAGAARPLRRPATRGLEQSWERAADFVIASLIGGWAVQKIVLALPGLSGKELPIADHANDAAIAVMAALVIRMTIETVAAHRYPKRLEEAAPAELQDPGPVQQLGASAVRVLVFVFLAYVIIGSSWQLWVGATLFVVPQVLGVFADRFPNSERLYRALPKGLVELVMMLFVATATGALLIATTNENAHDFLANSFVLLSLPGFALSIAGLFGREGDDRDMGWGKRIGGAAILAVGILLVQGLLI